MAYSYNCGRIDLKQDKIVLGKRLLFITNFCGAIIFMGQIIKLALIYVVCFVLLVEKKFKKNIKLNIINFYNKFNPKTNSFHIGQEVSIPAYSKKF